MELAGVAVCRFTVVVTQVKMDGVQGSPSRQMIDAGPLKGLKVAVAWYNVIGGAGVPFK